jgi:potassium uptake TrkH family protein
MKNLKHLPINRHRRRLTSVQIIVIAYFIATIVATTLLLLPIAHRPGVQLSWIDALFTAASAISVTGLTVVNTAETFSVFGVIIIIVFIQLGGIGIMALGTFIWILLGKQIGLRERKLIALDQNRSTLSGLVSMMKHILGFAIVIEAIGTILLTFHFRIMGYYDHWLEAFYYGFFSSLSAFTNAGFDIFGNSLISFKDDYIVQMINIVLIVLGAIGFPVLFEVKEYFVQKGNFRFSLFTKVTSLTFFLLVLSGAILFYISERTYFFADKSWHETLFYSLFHSVSTRSGGLTTMDMGLLTQSTLLMLAIMMFIGASPSSVGGGIRTTTLAVIFLKIKAFALGHREVKVMRRELHHDDVEKSFIVFAVGVSMVLGAILLLSMTESISILAVIVEVTSAFGTTGLSTGATSELTIFGKIVLTLLMFVGRIGILSLLFLVKRDERKANIHYAKEHLIIG